VKKHARLLWGVKKHQYTHSSFVNDKGGGKVKAEDDEKNKHDLLLAQGKIAPCIGCHEVCTPEYCSLLDEWLELLV
jgi:hypothetical protein